MNREKLENYLEKNPFAKLSEVVTQILYDQIVVLDDGRMVGLGRHADLLKTCPVYEEIYASQFKKGDAQK